MRTILCRSNPVDPDPRVEKTAASLASAGHSVQVLAWDRLGRLPDQEQKTWGAIRRFGLVAAYGSGLHNLIPLLRWQAWLTWQLFQLRTGFDLIHACDFDTILPSLLVGRLSRKPVVYDIFDFYIEHLRHTPDFLRRVIRRLDLAAVRRAAAVIVVDEARLEQIAAGQPRRVEVIYNTPPDCLEELGREAPTAPGSSLRIAYVGILQVERGLLDIYAALRRHPAWRFDLAGFGGDEAPLLEAARDRPNVHWHGRVPYFEALKLMHAADMLVALYDPAVPNHRLASPNKLFEAMMLGKPVIAARGTHIDELIAQSGCGIAVPYGDVNALEEAFLRLEADPDLRLRLGQNARLAYLRQYSWERMERRLLDLYSGLAGGAR